MEKKPARRTVMISTSASRMLQRRASEEHRSMTGHLEWLIEQDAEGADAAPQEQRS